MHTIGIDMSKDTFHAAFDETCVAQFANSPAGLDAFLAALRDQGAAPGETTIGCEATGAYHLFLAEQLRRRSWRIVILNPLLTHRMAQRTTVRNVKTDRKDALTIRSTLLAGAGYRYTDTPAALALKTLVQEREALVRVRAGLKQRLGVHALKAAAAGIALRDPFSGPLAALTRAIKDLERRMGAYERETQTLLRSIPGIGAISAGALVAYVDDIHRFPSAEKLTAYLGLDCRVYESGTSVKGKGYLTKRGNSSLRHLLFQAAFIARQRNPALKAYFLKKRSEGKHYFSALCAVERKLVHLVYAVWTRGTPFEARSSGLPAERLSTAET